ncbi:MAG: hypothetical protein LC130_28735 [Bryobacterales bacterium]|nr:hypothetical protein [Bryobacterales bacterium]
MIVEDNPSGKTPFLWEFEQGGSQATYKYSKATSVYQQVIAIAIGAAYTAYTVAYIAHAPLEPRAAVAQWENGKLPVRPGDTEAFRRKTGSGARFRDSGAASACDRPRLRTVFEGASQTFFARPVGSFRCEYAV